MFLNSFFDKLKSYFVYGLFVVIPVFITIAIVFFLIQILITPINDTFNSNISPFYGIILAFIIITVIGFFSRNLVGRVVLNLFEIIISKLPLINRIYDSSKHIIDVFSSQKHKDMKSVLVEYPKSGMWAIGFLTRTTMDELGASFDNDKNMVSVFIPTTPNPTSGYLIFVDKSKLIFLNTGFEETVKTLVSAGVVNP